MQEHHPIVSALWSAKAEMQHPTELDPFLLQLGDVSAMTANSLSCIHSPTISNRNIQDNT